MICISIGDYGLDACRKALRRCEKYRRQFPDLVAEIRLDLCGLGEDEVHELFSGSRIPLIATCMKRSSHLCEAAVLAGAVYVDINVFSYISLKKEEQALLRSRGTRLILSFHDYQMTPKTEALAKVYKEAVRAGADIVKIVTTASSTEDALRVLDLYRMQRDGSLGRRRVPLTAFAMGDEGRFSRLEAYRLGAPFIYCALRKKDIVAPGMFTMEEVENFQDKTVVSGTVAMPASKSVAQRAIIAAMLARGESEFHNCTRCRDIDSAIGVAKQFAQEAYVDKGGDLIIRGGFPPEKKKSESPFSSLISMSMQSGGRTAFVGESGLLSRLCIPVMAQLGESVTVTGEGSLMDRHMYGCKEAMEEMGASCLLTAGETLPAVVCGPIKGGEITLSGKKGSQFITGLLMALPLSKKDSVLRVQNATSVPYILLTVDVMQKFGVTVDWHQEGDELVFNIPGKQKYSPAEMTFEGDWSAAVNFIVAAAVFGSLTITGLNLNTIQADKKIMDVVRNCGAGIEELPGDGGIRITRGSLRAFDFDATDSPDLVPALSVLAAFSEGTSHFTGVARLRNKESNRPVVMEEGLKAMGVPAKVDGDTMEITGMSLTRRMLEGKMLKGGNFHTFSDHRVAMALKVASLGCSSKVTLDSTDCIDKSFPGFLKLFESIHQ